MVDERTERADDAEREQRDHLDEKSERATSHAPMVRHALVTRRCAPPSGVAASHAAHATSAACRAMIAA